MREGLSLQQLAAEVQRQTDLKQDYIADTRSLYLDVDTPDGRPVLKMDSELESPSFNPTAHAHTQIASRLGIPKKYYDRMLGDHPDLLAKNVNHLFDKEPEKRMLRTIGPDLRGFVSNSYKAIDNDLGLAAVMGVLVDEVPDVQVMSSSITETKIYLKVVAPQLRDAAMLQPGVHKFIEEPFAIGLEWQNSEVAQGKNKFGLYVVITRCINGYQVDVKLGLQQTHLGSKQEQEGLIVWAEDTRRQQAEAMKLEMRDACRQILSVETVAEVKAKMELAGQQKIPVGGAGGVIGSVERLSKATGLTEAEGGSILEHLIEGGSLSQWGFAQAVTRHSTDVEDYDRASDLERIGGNILTLSPTQWAAAA